ncbi:NusG domain II-containing protein [Ectothiorhodospiraceae bacterium 2226]|nr:NusG domain II-containing protein [Ectothiorhodospiraceae bacterium 2226]
MTRADFLALLGGAALLPVLYWRHWGTEQGPPVAARLLDPGGDRLVRLDRNGEYRVQGSRGVSVIEVREGRVRFADSACRNRHCIHRGWLGAAGETAACVPNRVALQILGRPRGYDVINY